MDTAENVHRNSQPLREQEATKLFENRNFRNESQLRVVDLNHRPLGYEDIGVNDIQRQKRSVPQAETSTQFSSAA
jgi:hypothetical protein